MLISVIRLYSGGGKATEEQPRDEQSHEEILPDTQIEEQAADIVFTDVVWSFETYESYSNGLVPLLNIEAVAQNKSGRTLHDEDIPSLFVDDKREQFSVPKHFFASLDKDETSEVYMTFVFDGDEDLAAPKEFEFRCFDEDATFSGLDGVAEEIEKAYAEKIVSVAEERKQQEEQRVAEEVQRRTEAAEARRLAEEQREANYLASTCWITPTGDHFHLTTSCSYIYGSDLTEMTVQEAQEQGYELCSRCAYLAPRVEMRSQDTVWSD